jgi:hypothetical protein
MPQLHFTGPSTRRSDYYSTLLLLTNHCCQCHLIQQFCTLQDLARLHDYYLSSSNLRSKSFESCLWNPSPPFPPPPHACHDFVLEKDSHFLAALARRIHGNVLFTALVKIHPSFYLSLLQRCSWSFLSSSYLLSYFLASNAPTSICCESACCRPRRS